MSFSKDVVRLLIRRGSTADIIAEMADSGIIKFESELRWNTETRELIIYDAGLNRRIHGLDMAVCHEGEVVTHEGEIIWLGEY